LILSTPDGILWAIRGNCAVIITIDAYCKALEGASNQMIDEWERLHRQEVDGAVTALREGKTVIFRGTEPEAWTIYTILMRRGHCINIILRGDGRAVVYRR